MLNKKAAFTLVELLVTIAILGIMSALSVAHYEEYKQKAYNIAAKQVLHDFVPFLYVVDSELAQQNSSYLFYKQAGVTATETITNQDGTATITDFFPSINDLNGSFKDIFVHLQIDYDSNGSRQLYARTLHCKGGGDHNHHSYNEYTSNSHFILTSDFANISVFGC